MLLVMLMWLGFKSSEVHKWSEEWVRGECLMCKQLQLNRLHIYFEEKARINLIDVFRLFIRYFAWKEKSEGEVTVHYGILIFDLDAVLKHSRFLMVSKEAWELAHDAVPCGWPPLALTLESPVSWLYKYVWDFKIEGFSLYIQFTKYYKFNEDLAKNEDKLTISLHGWKPLPKWMADAKPEECWCFCW